MARTFQRCAAAIMVCAWGSLGVQLRVLMGERGLLPARDMLAARAAAGDSFWTSPVLFGPGVMDATLHAGVLVGILVTLLSGLGIASRLGFGVSGLLYLSYVTLGRDFLAFQWDNLFIETCALLCCLPRDRAAPLAHFAFRLLLFKLYFESGIAKWQSHLGDWQDGSAMTFYYETAPLPAGLAPHAHHLPDAWHHFESWAALVMELPLPFLIFGPRPARLLVFGVLTGFQIANTLTANYGFFTYLACALHVFLLDDADLERAAVWVRRRMPGLRARATRSAIRHSLVGVGPVDPGGPVRRLRAASARLLLITYAGLSLALSCAHFAGSSALGQAGAPLARGISPLRLVNTYYLFGHITRARIEPEFQVRLAGQWEPRHLRYKPGDPARPPPYVAPHQPRVDFRLWFYGLSFQRGMPRYVRALLDRLCNAPDEVRPLFAQSPPAAPEAVRIVFYQYRFTDPAVLAHTHQTWHRERLGETRPLICEP